MAATRSPLMDAVRTELRAVRAKVAAGQITETQAQDASTAVFLRAYDRLVQTRGEWVGGFSENH